MAAFSTRHFWLDRLRAAWRGKTVVSLSGLRVEFVGLEGVIGRVGRARPG